MIRPRLTRRDLRLGSGLLLFGYIATHLANHALGLISVAAGEAALGYAVLVWHSLPGTILLYGAAAVHVSLAFDAIYQRRTLRMPPLEVLRIALGLGIPILLIGHVVGTRVAWEAYDVSTKYSRVVWNLWMSDSEGRQLAMLVPGWLHGCLGIHFAFVRRTAYRRLRYLLFGIALLLPVLGGLGFIAMARELAADVAHHADFHAALELDAAKRIALARTRDTVLAVYLAAVAAVFGARVIRAWVERRQNALVAITYPQRVVTVPRGWTVLEASRSHHLPHVSMCGGRARCSTCRVRVTAGLLHCPPPGDAEQRTLLRIGAPADVRLACQLRPEGAIGVVPLLAAATAPAAHARESQVTEHDVAVVSVQWRNRAAFAETHLPPDYVFMSKLFGETVSGVFRANGGTEGDAIGNSVTAVFGLGGSLATACRDALAAAASIEHALGHLEHQYAREFGSATDFAIAVHAGHAAIGYIGIVEPRRLMAAGGAIEAVRAMQAAVPRERLVVSAVVIERAGLASDAMRWREIPVAGPERPLRIAAGPIPLATNTDTSSQAAPVA